MASCYTFTPLTFPMRVSSGVSKAEAAIVLNSERRWQSQSAAEEDQTCARH